MGLINLVNITAGSLRDSISFVKEVITQNEKGFQVKQNTVSFTCRCKAEHVNTRDIYRMGQINADTDFKFTIRTPMVNKIEKEHKIQHKKKLYTVVYKEPLYNNRNYTVLYCVEFNGKKNGG